jgi:hypothetical protein
MGREESMKVLVVVLASLLAVTGCDSPAVLTTTATSITTSS